MSVAATDELPMDHADETVALTTPELESALSKRYPRDRYAFFLNVPDAVSLDARRRIDAIAVGVWQSVGRQVDAFELKVSRADWLRELKQIDKADPFVAICDRFWLVTGHKAVAKLEEIPACWGWLNATKHGLRVERPAKKLPTERENMPWAFTVGLLRKLQDDLVSSPDVRAAIATATADLEAQHAYALDRAAANSNRSLADLKERVDTFEKAAGVEIHNWDSGNVGEAVKQIHALRYHGGIEALDRLLGEQIKGAATLLRILEEARAAAAPSVTGAPA